MDSAGERPCSFCGTKSVSNAELNSEPTVTYSDGETRASVSTVILCRECANDIDEYFDARQQGKSSEDRGDAQMTEDTARKILSAVSESSVNLLTAVNLGYGVRYIEGEWKHAFQPAPAPATVETIAEDELINRILSTRRVTIKRLSGSGWDWWMLDK